jgi:hypothetical protein
MLTCYRTHLASNWPDAEMAPAQRHAEPAEQLQLLDRLDLDIRRTLALPGFRRRFVIAGEEAHGRV